MAQDWTRLTASPGTQAFPSNLSPGAICPTTTPE